MLACVTVTRTRIEVRGRSRYRYHVDLMGVANVSTTGLRWQRMHTFKSGIVRQKDALDFARKISAKFSVIYMTDIRHGEQVARSILGDNYDAPSPDQWPAAARISSAGLLSDGQEFQRKVVADPSAGE